MKNFVGNIISAALEVIMWTTLIACVIGGACIGKSIDNAYLPVGLVIGAFAGMLINIFLGFISLFVEIRDYVKEIAEKEDVRESREEQKLSLGSFTDARDGKTYKTVTIGKQTWMAENLSYATEGSKCYNNNPANGQKYGRLYDWEMAKAACPSGWHLPSDKEWQELVDFTGGDKVAGKKFKARSGWNNNGNGTDDYKFSALPGGNGNSDGSFSNVGEGGYWWSATENDASNAYFQSIYYDGADAGRNDYDKTGFFSVRCVQD